VITAFNQLESYKKIYKINDPFKIIKIIRIIGIATFICLFLPWTQNLRLNGFITALSQEERPTQINSQIPGQIAQWYVKEGDIVRQGDTIIKLSEIKSEYLDENLLARTQEQIKAKKNAANSYLNKSNSYSDQVAVFTNALKTKIDQIDNKIYQQNQYIKIDSTNLSAAKLNLELYKRQIDGAKQMYENGVISLIEYEKRNVTYQSEKAKMIALENKLQNSKQELSILSLERNLVKQEYSDKILKSEAEKYSSIADAESANYDLSKLNNAYANYDARNKMYYILSPMSGQVGTVNKGGKGNIIKEGDYIAEIIPDISTKSVELFISPVDLPLTQAGQEIQLIFDGYPVINFGGWPQLNYGTFKGEIKYIEKAADAKGNFRALIVEKADARKWPPSLSVGSGAHGIALLKNVPVFYEIWRKINGFPPEYYEYNNENKIAKSK
jgi:multidrug efflux pump subunit AcrA (membrane-fusion protein)